MYDWWCSQDGLCTCKKIEDVSVNIKTHVQKHYKIVAENKEENMAEILKTNFQTKSYKIENTTTPVPDRWTQVDAYMGKGRLVQSSDWG